MHERVGVAGDRRRRGGDARPTRGASRRPIFAKLAGGQEIDEEGLNAAEGI